MSQIVKTDEVQKMIRLLDDSAAAKLYKDYQEKLKCLQNMCQHSFVADWAKEYTPYGQTLARMVQTCINCNKIIVAKEQCCECYDYFSSYEIKIGDGNPIPRGQVYCNNCYPVGMMTYQRQRNSRGEWNEHEGRYVHGKALKCSKCDQKAEFFKPSRLCLDHWVEWYVDSLKTAPEMRATIACEVRSQMRRAKERGD